ncbi:MAG TPA: phage terminase small subunit P27 family [archaeon]|nr:phage terminase small subunit P27 family [archaeon]
MGKRGPKPEPTRLKLVKGNPGRRPLNKLEPEPQKKLLRCPSYLDKEEKRIWQITARKLYDMGVLTQADDIALAGFCEYYSEYRKLTELVKKNGVFIKIKNGKETKMFVDPETGEKISQEADWYVVRRSPVAMARDKARAIASRIMDEFGMKPSARAQLRTELEQGVVLS